MASGAGEGMVVRAAPVEAAAEGVVFVLVEVDRVGETSALRAEVTSVASECLATLVRGRALKGRARGVRVSRGTLKGKTDKLKECD